jgi:hypothetical protein
VINLPPEIIEYMDPGLLIQVSIGVMLVLFILVIDITTNSMRIINLGKYILSSEKEKLKKIERQFTVILNHAPTYINSLGKKGSDMIQEIDTIIIEKEESLAQLNNFIQHGEIEDILNLIEEEKEKRQGMIWTSRAESLIRELGNKISKASTYATEAGLPKNNSEGRESTKMSLTQARIIPGQKQID